MAVLSEPEDRSSGIIRAAIVQCSAVQLVRPVEPLPLQRFAYLCSQVDRVQGASILRGSPRKIASHHSTTGELYERCEAFLRDVHRNVGKTCRCQYAVTD